MFTALLEAATHYAYPAPDLKHDRAKQYVDWEESGSYSQDTLGLVPLNKVKYSKWSQDRADRLLPKMKVGTPINSVRLSRMVDGSYTVGDGNHRSHVSQQLLGYTHVHAIVSQEVFEEPEHPAGNAVKGEEAGRELFRFIESLRIKNVTEVQVQWGSVGPHDYKVLVLHDNGEKAEIRVMLKEASRTMYVVQDGKVLSRAEYGGAPLNTMAHDAVKILTGSELVSDVDFVE